MDEKLHEIALERFDEAESSQRDEREQCLEDRRFYSIAGAQWEGALGEQYENKPQFEVNKIHLSVMRIINDYRNNRITLSFVNKDEHQGSKLANTLNGLFRVDEQDSNADEAYDNAFEEAVGGGFGAFRLRSVYEEPDDEESEYQRIEIEPIHDADSCVYFDAGAKRQDKRDARFCFVITSMTREAFEAEFPDQDPASWAKNVSCCEFDWVTADWVYVAEYYVLEKRPFDVHIYHTVAGQEERYTEDDFENDPSLSTTLKAVGTAKVRTRTVQRQRVHKYLLSGMGILKDYGLLSGSHIPIVPVYGKRWIVDNVERMMGHVRLSRDAQRLKNMETSKLAEISALSPLEKPIFTPEQVAGHEYRWAQDHLKNYPYLLLNSTIDKDGNPVAMGPAGYTKPPAVPPALAALLTMADTDLNDLLGKPDAAVQDVASNVSGVAVELVQTKFDMQTFIYMSNFARALKRAGEIYLSMAKEIYVEEQRELRIIDGNGEVSKAKLNIPLMDEKTGALAMDNDISKAKCIVTTMVGPSSSTKRNATARALIAMSNMNQDPETAKILGRLILMNIEGEGIDDARSFFRMQLVRAGVLTPTPKESAILTEEAKNAKPSANDAYLLAAAEAQKAAASESRADTIKSLAGAEKLNAEKLQLLASIDQNALNTAISVLQVMREVNTPTAPAQPTQ